MTTDQYRHDLAKRAVDNLLFGVSNFRVEALRITDGELQTVAFGEQDEFVGFP